MPAESYFQLLNPLVFLLFAGGFFTVNAVRPSKAVLLLAISYLCGALAFTVDIVEQAGLFSVGIIVVGAIYAVTATLASAGLSLHYRGSAPWRLFAVIFAAHLSLYSWTFLQNGAGWTSSFVANFGCGVIFTVGLVAIRNHMPRKIDKLVFWLFAVGCLQCFVRPLVMVYFSGGSLSPENFDQALFIMMLHFVVGACAVMLGMALLVACSTNIIEDLQIRSVTDRLSGVLNRRGFEEAAERLFDGKRADERFLTVVLADIDYFKHVNDTKGHAFGDMVITELGAMFNLYADGARLAGRLGGEEFVMLLVDEPLDAAKDVAEALRRDFAALRIETLDRDASDIAFTASFGVAMRQPGESLLEVISRADEALYLSKAKGRNCVSCETDIAVNKLRSVSTDRRKRRGGETLSQTG